MIQVFWDVTLRQAETSSRHFEQLLMTNILWHFKCQKYLPSNSVTCQKNQIFNAPVTDVTKPNVDTLHHTLEFLDSFKFLDYFSSGA